jgi:hypothetical protein
MAGAYCRFCGQRCFVLRVIPDGPSAGWSGHLATCPGGMAHDRKATGHDHATAINPITDPAAAKIPWRERLGPPPGEGEVARREDQCINESLLQEEATARLAAEHEGTPALGGRIKLELPGGQVIRIDRCCDHPRPGIHRGTLRDDPEQAREVMCAACHTPLIAISWRESP